MERRSNKKEGCIEILTVYLLFMVIIAFFVIKTVKEFIVAYPMAAAAYTVAILVTILYRVGWEFFHEDTNIRLESDRIKTYHQGRVQPHLGNTGSVTTPNRVSLNIKAYRKGVRPPQGGESTVTNISL